MSCRSNIIIDSKLVAYGEELVNGKEFQKIQGTQEEYNYIVGIKYLIDDLAIIYDYKVSQHLEGIVFDKTNNNNIKKLENTIYNVYIHTSNLTFRHKKSNYSLSQDFIFEDEQFDKFYINYYKNYFGRKED